MADWQDYTAHDHNDQRAHGLLKILRGLHSPQLNNARDVTVYLPPSYPTRGDRRYPVLYMHDGQNLFDPRTSFAGEWHVDGVIDAASDEGLEAIVVGIPNMGAERCNEYSPFDDARHGPARGDAYLHFVIDTLKPIIDADFRTHPVPHQTGIVGSSMGGLISLYGFFARPDVFGLTGVMSPALWYGQREIFSFLEQAHEARGRIYVDVGTKEGTEELRDVTRLRDRLLEIGYRHGHDLLFIVDFGAGHNEEAWARRMKKMLEFFYKQQSDAEPAIDAVITSTVTSAHSG
ncbi:MAG TPA: alpha/beta hydrolase-fold protein [Longimicrobiales bacterium]|nr:alpha/beta hydrolase-fold protein [Longimicrobiales bacterium]